MVRIAVVLLSLAFSLASSLSSQPRKPVIGMGGIVHETNTFNPRKTTVKDFEEGIGVLGVLRGDEIIRESANAQNTTTGFIEGAAQYGLTLHPTLMAGPQTIGTVTREAFESLTTELVTRLQSGPKLDGILLFLHGTMVAEGFPHADAEVVRRVRAAFGRAIPVMVVHDYHANVSEEIVELTTALITYKECPHLDAKDRGVQAAKLMADTVAGRVKPVQAMVKPPMIFNIIFQNTYAPPYKPITDASKELEKNPKVLAASVPGGYQWSDIPAMGPAAIVVTDGDAALARREAERLSGMLWAARDKLALRIPDPAGAVRMAMAEPKGPVVLMDTGDNIGGGTAGDSTFILAELLKQKAKGWVVIIADPGAAEAAFKAGINGAFDQQVGGKTDNLHGDRVRVRGRVKTLTDGRFLEPQIRHGGGRYWDMGPSAVIEVEGSTRDEASYLLLTPKRVIPFSLHQLVSVGIYPERQRILAVKGTIAPRAAYEPVASRIIEVDSGGAAAVNPKRFQYKNVRPGLFGLE